MNYIIERLKEASTWRGIMAFITGIGIAISPELQAQIITLGLAAMGMVGMVAKDKNNG